MFISIRQVSVVISVSVLLSLVPFLFAQAASETLFGPDSATVDRDLDYITGLIDASSHNGLQLSFDYDATKLEATDSFTYGWSDGSDHDLQTINGITNEVPEEIDSITVSLPPEAQINGLVVYVKVTAGSSGTYDYVDITNLTVTGEPAIADTDGDTIPDGIDLCFGTVADEPTDWERSQGRYMWSGTEWLATEKGSKDFMPDMDYTYGCSATQILDGLYEATGMYYGGHYKHGISKSVLEYWHQQAF